MEYYPNVSSSQKRSCHLLYPWSDLHHVLQCCLFVNVLVFCNERRILCPNLNQTSLSQVSWQIPVILAPRKKLRQEDYELRPAWAIIPRPYLKQQQNTNNSLHSSLYLSSLTSSFLPFLCHALPSLPFLLPFFLCFFPPTRAFSSDLAALCLTFILV